MTRHLKLATSASVPAKTPLPDSGQTPAQPPQQDQRRQIQFATQTERSEDFMAHAPKHIRGGADELDGDLVDVDLVPTNYTRTTDGTATNAEHLRAHLNGIDAKLGNVVARAALLNATLTTTAGSGGAQNFVQWNNHGAPQATEANGCFAVMPRAGVCKLFAFYCPAYSGSAGHNVVLVLRKNGADESPTHTLTAANLADIDSSNTVPFVAGDRISIGCTNDDGLSHFPNTTMSVLLEFEP